MFVLKWKDNSKEAPDTVFIGYPADWISGYDFACLPDIRQLRKSETVPDTGHTVVFIKNIGKMHYLFLLNTFWS